LLRDYHGGADGRVWLACDAKGHLAVIKFPRIGREDENDEEKQKVTDEVELWHKCGLKLVYACKVAKRHAIIMPFAFHYKIEGNVVSVDERRWKGEGLQTIPAVKDFALFLALAKSKSPQEVLHSCVTACASAKLVHSDIEWRHIAMFSLYRKEKRCFFSKKEMILQLNFIDLSQMEVKISTEEVACTMDPRKIELLQQLQTNAV
jgi:hypothetical protein